MTAKNATRIFGLGNCDSCRKARRWFDAHGHAYDFADIREPGNADYVVTRIARADNWTAFVNRRSTTWRALPAGDKDDLNRQRALNLLRAHPTLIKRPVIVIGDDTCADHQASAVVATQAASSPARARKPWFRWATTI